MAAGLVFPPSLWGPAEDRRRFTVLTRRTGKIAVLRHYSMLVCWNFPWIFNEKYKTGIRVQNERDINMCRFPQRLTSSSGCKMAKGGGSALLRCEAAALWLHLCHFLAFFVILLVLLLSSWLDERPSGSFSSTLVFFMVVKALHLLLSANHLKFCPFTSSHCSETASEAGRNLFINETEICFTGTLCGVYSTNDSVLTPLHLQQVCKMLRILSEQVHILLHGYKKLPLTHFTHDIQKLTLLRRPARSIMLVRCSSSPQFLCIQPRCSVMVLMENAEFNHASCNTSAKHLHCSKLFPSMEDPLKLISGARKSGSFTNHSTLEPDIKFYCTNYMNVTITA